MTRWGIGPKLVGLSALLASPLLVARAIWADAFAIHFAPRLVTTIAGSLLLAAGIPFCASAMRTLHRGFPKGELFTGGVYGFCRNPIYASWIVFLVPGIFLLLSSWLFALVPLAMYAALRLTIHREEAWLETTFGEKYRAYRERVPAVLPVPRWKGRRSPASPQR